ncbi:MAG TPA: uroporphyrinogen-III C-methyltransferase [Burkholderiales bacterium]|nr:uroporphyrinogen-III C-methyltransferase [Burkholderiales bacterium]
MDTSEPKPRSDPPVEPAVAPEPPAAPGAPGLAWRLLQVLLLAAALGASGWVWYDARLRAGAAEASLERRLGAMQDEAREARAAARASQDTVRDLQAKLAVLDGRLADTQSQQTTLETLYQELSRNRDEWQIAEIEQVLAIADQQLQLTGNVKAALIALQLAEARLARADRPQFQAVRRAIARDIERLKSLPTADLAGMSRRLDTVIGSIDALPLGGDVKPAPPAPPPPAAGGAGDALKRFGSGLWRDLKDLVVVRRVEAPEPPLLPAPEAYYLRENLRLRLLNARLELVSRHPAAFAQDLKVAQEWLARYYERDAPATREALDALKALAQTPLRLEPLSISDSLEAVRAFKAQRERASG